jgi:hypothetical protein
MVVAKVSLYSIAAFRAQLDDPKINAITYVLNHLPLSTSYQPAFAMTYKKDMLPTRIFMSSVHCYYVG